MASAAARTLFDAAGGREDVAIPDVDCSDLKDITHSMAVDVNSTFLRKLYEGTECMHQGSLCMCRFLMLD